MKKSMKLVALIMSAMMLITTTGFSFNKSKEAPVELTMAWLVTGAQPADLALVEAEVNKIVTPKINAKIKLMPINFGAAMQQYNLMLSSGEKLDLMITFPTTYTSLVAQKKVQEIGPLVEKYGQGIKKALGKFYNGTAVNGKMYGVRPITEMAGGGGFMIRKDILDKYKLKASDIKSLKDVENVLKTIKKNEPNSYPMTYSAQTRSIVETLMSFESDNLSDNFGVLMNKGQSLRVENLFETKLYKDSLKMVRDWYLKGYIMKDIATNKEDQHSLIASGKAYSYFTGTKPGIEVQESVQNGYTCVVPQFSVPISTSFNATLFCWVVPNACKAPDKAVQMLNLMYTDAKLENLLSWGIEGKHYEKKSDGTIGFPKGVDQNSSGYYMMSPWMMGNQLLVNVWSGNPTDLWAQTAKFASTALLSKASGFTYNPTPVKTAVASVSNVWNQYKMGLESGAADIDTVYPQFISKLKAAGIDKIIAEKQRQFTTWAIKNKVK